MKIHSTHNQTVNGISYQYFYLRLKNDVNGNPRYRVFVLDPDGPAAYEKTLCSYEIHADVLALLNRMEAAK